MSRTGDLLGWTNHTTTLVGKKKTQPDVQRDKAGPSPPEVARAGPLSGLRLQKPHKINLQNSQGSHSGWARHGVSWRGPFLGGYWPQVDTGQQERAGG